ncbi:formyltetrahydrofolate deformylase [Marinithermofilum abyssi]|uniref:Formyltetrahydrofolate deformylase n=2 Tax=Marinithermofilum abyssi TaxID=1571185 RepID=A0A8J2VE17_9BACL|nr:formyltetrahydrofolate deformylase [Marinithermofilum abyssi]GGE04635.1 formyltetrahydrofolate deformylase [Marinithermofilum abyssi]
MNEATDFQSTWADRGRLLISCPDRPGIVAAVSRFLYEQGANIVQSDQHTTDPEGGRFFMRVEFQVDHLPDREQELKRAFQHTADTFQMEWRMTLAARKKRLALFVSKEDHCLQELLWRWRIGELHADIAMVISNHRDLEPAVAPFGIPYHHVPVNKETRLEAEVKHLELMKDKVDAVVLARYMQIIPSRTIQAYQNRIINIHHSFLPAFVGAKPYHQAHERGVKIIGATAHYVTEELDQGPIIEQDVQRVDHRCRVEDLKRIGRDVERLVLAKAVNWHLNDQVLVHGNKTVVFR